MYVCMYVCMYLCMYAFLYAALCISAGFLMCLEAVNQHIIKEELDLIINVHNSIFITDNRGNVELILGRDYRIHFWLCSRLRIFLLS